MSEPISCAGCGLLSTSLEAQAAAGIWFCGPQCQTAFEKGIEFSRVEERAREVRGLEQLVTTCLQVHCAAMITTGLLIAKVDPPDVTIRACSLVQDLVDLIDLHGTAELDAKIGNLEATIADLRARHGA
jgi:hypothetical protein